MNDADKMSTLIAQNLEMEENMRRLRGTISSDRARCMRLESELKLFKEKLVWSEKRVLELEQLLFKKTGSLPLREPVPSKSHGP